MLLFMMFLSIYSPNSSFQENLLNSSFKSEKNYQFSRYAKARRKRGLNYRVGCHLAIEYQKDNNYREAKTYLINCKKLGRNYREIYDYLKLKEYLYFNDKRIFYYINRFVDKYEDSIFVNDAELMKARYYLKNSNYKSSYYRYKSLLEDLDLSKSKTDKIEILMAYLRWKFIKTDIDNYILSLKLFKYKNSIPKKDLEEIKSIRDNTDIKTIKKWIKLSYEKDMIYNIKSFLYLLRVYDKKKFTELVKDKKLFEDKRVKLYYEFNIYWANSKVWSFEAKEIFLDRLLREYRDEASQKDLLYKKALLFHYHKKSRKRVRNYQKMIELGVQRKRESYFLLKSGVYSLDYDDIKGAKRYFTQIVEKFNRWYKEYNSAIWMLFKIYRKEYKEYKASLEKKEKKDITEKEKKNLKAKKEKLLGIMKKLEKYNMKMESYYYKIKDNLASDKKEVKKLKKGEVAKSEKEKILEYFSYRPHFFYYKMLNKEINNDNFLENWKKNALYQKVDLNFNKKNRLEISNIYSVNKFLKITKKEKKNLYSLINEFTYLREWDMVDKLLAKFYYKFYRIKYQKRRNRLDEDEKLFLTSIKKINKNYLIHLLNFFIKQKNYKEVFLMMHRHFRYLKHDDKYKYYYHPFPYPKIIDKYAKEFNINPLLILSIMETESIFNPNAYSSAGAVGLMQIMPQTGRLIAKDLKVKNYSLYNPEDNIHFGAYYLSNLLKRFYYQIPFASASYNGGPHNMKRWLKSHEKENLPLDEMIDEIEFKESRHYAKKIIRLFSTYSMLYQNKKILIPTKVKYKNRVGNY